MTTQLSWGIPFTLPAAAALSGKQYRGGSINTSGQIALIALGTTRVDGIIQHDAASGEQVRIETQGILKVAAGANVTVGALASMDTTGRAVISVTSGDLRFGKFLDAGAVGEIVRVLIQNGLPNVP